MTYDQWISDFLARTPIVRGMCHCATSMMVSDFPELKKVAGFCNGHEHWWCVAPDGSIVDPTVKQFEEMGFTEFDYSAWKVGDTVRVGRCMNCGDDIYENVQSLEGGRRRCVCSDECRKALEREYNNDRNAASRIL